MNLVDVELTGQGARVGEHTVPIPRTARTELGRQGADRATLGSGRSRLRWSGGVRGSRSR